MAKRIPINPRIISQMAQATISNLYDAIVELVTNSDDSYRRLEESGIVSEGKIQLEVFRKKGGLCEKIIITDFAEGMSRQRLEAALEFAGNSSGFSEGKSVRGFFGRGLKETIIALGEADIVSYCNGKKIATRVWYDPKDNACYYDDNALNKESINEEIKNGTVITIRIKYSEKYRLCEFDKFKNIISTHYALRDINSNAGRNFLIIFNDEKRNIKHKHRITYSYRKDKLIKEATIPLSEDNATINLAIYESEEKLEFNKYDPTNTAGILIKTKDSILDNTLFGLETELAALYFWGYAYCEDISNRLRSGDLAIIDPNRKGLNWNNELCKKIENAIVNILRPFIDEKKKLLNNMARSNISDTSKKMMIRLCAKLNEIAKNLINEDSSLPQAADDSSLLKIENLTIRPSKTTIPINTFGYLTIYAPVHIVNKFGYTVSIAASNKDVAIHLPTVKLSKSKSKSDLEIYSGSFSVRSSVDGLECIIEARLGDRVAKSIVIFGAPKERNRRNAPIRKGGLFTNIIIDDSPEPTQRTFYNRNDGSIRIYINFPSTRNWINHNLELSDNPAGRMLLAELVGEAFCREVARRRALLDPPPPGGEIDAYNREYSLAQKKSLGIIQELIGKYLG